MTDSVPADEAEPTTLSARFEVTGWNPSALTGLDGDGEWVGAVIMQKTYTSGLVGTSVAEFLSSGSEEAGRGYLAAERITGTLDDGRSGSFTVHHGALQPSAPQHDAPLHDAPQPGAPQLGAPQHPGDPSSFGYIVPGTGTGDFVAFAGPARIEHDDAGPYFVFTLDG